MYKHIIAGPLSQTLLRYITLCATQYFREKRIKYFSFLSKSQHIDLHSATFQKIRCLETQYHSYLFTA